ncbi:hypothetical protein FNF29_08008 [Cafeteria roenbergensis]|uniref:Uncharacterized protein n=1 Tax=Cafeteria roenbergensis TaxID=33653 RepID=A0A5A8C0M4_CAFRO|nr:hypothetical protein FNF29_08008 [Cafeteria roenbergensis]|eukprot:KAA0146536.1 hypothetical protein FNF29_08008 [Cafeteria roenbergensis]
MAALVAAAAALLACDGVVGAGQPHSLRGALDQANKRATRAASHAWAAQLARGPRHSVGRPAGADLWDLSSAARFRQQTPVRVNRRRQATTGSAWVARGEEPGFLSSVEEEADDDGAEDEELGGASIESGPAALEHSSARAPQGRGSSTAGLRSGGGASSRGGDVAWDHRAAHRFESDGGRQSAGDRGSAPGDDDRPLASAGEGSMGADGDDDDDEAGDGFGGRADGAAPLNRRAGRGRGTAESSSPSLADGYSDDEDNDDEDAPGAGSQSQDRSHSRQQQQQQQRPGSSEAGARASQQPPSGGHQHHRYRQGSHGRRHSLGDEVSPSVGGGAGAGVSSSSQPAGAPASVAPLPAASRAADGIPEPVYLDSAPAADAFFKQAASRAAELQARPPEEREERLPPTTSSDSGSGRGVPQSASAGGIEGSAGLRRDAERAVGGMDPTLAFAPPAEPAIDERHDDPASAAAIPALASEDESQSNFEASLDRDTTGMGGGAGGGVGGGAGELESALAGMRMGGGPADPSGALDPPGFAV